MTSVPLSLRSHQDTQRLAGAVAAAISPGVTLGLEGELGAGKTTFVRYLVEALGGRGTDVSSPTFTLQYDYPIREGVTLEHWDLYRLSSTPPELLEAPGPKTVRVIEWPDRCPEVLRDIDLLIRIGLPGGDVRTVTFSGRVAPSVLV
jgi:tRNA threonylcarbamoyladenosine biosynthesis protein TsaE